MVSSGFFNSIQGDRKYNATQMSSLFDGIITDGCFKDYGQKFLVSPGSGMNVIVGTGRAWFDHTWTLNDSDTSLEIEESSGLYWRRDMVVLEIGTAQAKRANTIKVVTGTQYAVNRSGLVDPTPGANQHVIAFVDVGPDDVSTIPSGQIRNMIPTDNFPYITAPLDKVSASQLYSHWDGEFNDWMNHLHEQLDSDPIGHLQTEIDDLQDQVDAITAKGDTWYNVTVSASGWSGSNYSFESTYPSSTYDIVALVPYSSTTANMRKAWAKAECGGYYNSNIMTANGTKPTIDIYLKICVRRK